MGQRKPLEEAVGSSTGTLGLSARELDPCSYLVHGNVKLHLHPVVLGARCFVVDALIDTVRPGGDPVEVVPQDPLSSRHCESRKVSLRVGRHDVCARLVMAYLYP